jgi:hypothetical protein
VTTGIPAGYDLDRIGYPTEGDYYVAHTDVVYQFPDASGVEIQHPVAIVSPKDQWRQMTKGTWKGQPLKARFRTKSDQPWTYGTLVDYKPGPMPWRSGEGRWFRVAEVWRK